jgi:hypothetical protein
LTEEEFGRIITIGLIIAAVGIFVGVRIFIVFRK